MYILHSLSFTKLLTTGTVYLHHIYVLYICAKCLKNIFNGIENAIYVHMQMVEFSEGEILIKMPTEQTSAPVNPLCLVFLLIIIIIVITNVIHIFSACLRNSVGFLVCFKQSDAQKYDNWSQEILFLKSISRRFSQ